MSDKGSPGLEEWKAAVCMSISDTRREKTKLNHSGLCMGMGSMVAFRADSVTSTHHSNNAEKFLLQKSATTTLPEYILWCGELIPMVQRAAHGARELMPPRVATKHWLKVLVNKYLAPQVRQLGGVISELQEASRRIKPQLPTEETSLLTHPE